MSNERYARHALIDWFSQERIAQTKVAVIGAGAVGNEVIKNLALLGVGQMDVFDFDRIEAHNLTRSVFFREADVGRSKAAVVSERARELDPNVAVRAFEGDFWDALSLHALMGYTCAIACVDNFEARIRLNQLCQIAGVDLVNAGLDSRYASVEVFPFSSASAVACYECHLPASAYQRIAERYSCGWLKKRAFDARKVPTTAITASAAGAFAVSLALRLGMADQSDTSRRSLLDTIGGSGSTVRLSRVAECVGCAAFSPRPQLLRAKRAVTASLEGLSDSDDWTLQSSDPLITGYRCARCGELPEASAMLLQRASRFDDRIMQCPRCRLRSVQIEIRDTFALAELRGMFELATDRPSAGQPVERAAGLPAKFILARSRQTSLCIELED